MCEGLSYSQGLEAWLGSLPTGTARSAGTTSAALIHASIPTVLGDSAVCLECSIHGIPFSVTPVITQNPPAHWLPALDMQPFPTYLLLGRDSFQQKMLIHLPCSLTLTTPFHTKQNMQTSLLSSGNGKNEYYVDVVLVFTTFPAFLLTNIWYR